MFRRLSVRGKILATLAVPVLVLIVAAAIIAGQAISTARVGSQTQAVAESTKAHDAVMTALQSEYGATLDAANGVSGAKEQLPTLREKTDKTRAAYLAEAGKIDFGRFPATVRSAWDQARDGLTNLDRKSVDAALAEIADINPQPTVIAVYDDAVRSQETFYTTFTDSVSDRDVAQYLALYAGTFDLRASFARETRSAAPVVTNHATIAADDAKVNNTVTALRSTDTQAATVTNTLAALNITDLDVPVYPAAHKSARDALLAGRVSAITATDARTWPAMVASYDESLATFQADVRERLLTSVSSAASAAWTQAWLTIAIAVLAVALSLLIALLIARRIVLPLSRLTASVGQVREELPRLVEQVAVPGESPDLVFEPIPVESTDEIGQLAAAFNDVNDTTIRVATEQAALRGSIAEMFVNVARRDHALLNRQLSFLDDLERTEEDPTVLSNLFRLDHLATRMRRNSESLLVLAGIDSGRRVREPMPLSDVVRTASSEIEAYDRMALTLPADPTMLGHVALSAAHLLAELLENATMFSDPSQPIDVTTHEDADYVSVAIRDHGLGMSAEEVEEANRKVASRSAADVVGAQRLGLYVVGRLADRLGAHVIFDANQEDGTLVVTAFPRSLFVSDATADQSPEETTVVAPSLITRDAESIAASKEWAPPQPVAPVDLAALTDGETALGMPRRRTQDDSDADVAGGGVAVGGGEANPISGGIAEDDIVLPALSAPSADEIALAEGTAEATWQPLRRLDEDAEQHLPSRGGLASEPLPARQPAVDVAQQWVPAPEDDVVPLDTERRAAVFSSFRSRDAMLDVEPDLPVPDLPVAEAPAVDVPVPDLPELALEPSAEPAFVPQFAPEPASTYASEESQPTTDSTRIVVPRHATSDDLERLMREYGGPEGVSAAVTGPVPILDPEYLAARAREQAETENEPSAISDELTSPTAAIEVAVPGLVPDSEPDDEAATAAFDLPTGSDLPTRSDLPTGSDEAVFDETAAVAGPASDASAAPGVLVEPQVATATDGWAAPAEATTLAVPTVVVPGVAPDHLPSFADVVADTPAEATKQPKKPGFFARIFGGKKKDSAAAESAAAPSNDDAETKESTFAEPSPEQTPAVVPEPVAQFPATFAPTDLDSAALVKASETTSAYAPTAGEAAAYQPVAFEPVAFEPEAGYEPSAPAPDYAPGSVTPPITSFSPSAASAPTNEGTFADFAPQVTPAVVSQQTGEDEASASQDATPRYAPPKFDAPAAPVTHGWSPETIDYDSPETPRSMSPELAAMLASRADLQDQALAELSQLSSYRPQEVTSQPAGGLARRQRTEVAAPVAPNPAAQHVSRDASVLRTRLSAFQSGTVRGRQAGASDGDDGGAPGHGGADAHDR